VSSFPTTVCTQFNCSVGGDVGDGAVGSTVVEECKLEVAVGDVVATMLGGGSRVFEPVGAPVGGENKGIEGGFITSSPSLYRKHRGCCLRNMLEPHLELLSFSGGIFFMAKISASSNVDLTNVVNDASDLVSDEELSSSADKDEISSILSLGLKLPRRSFAASARCAFLLLNDVEITNDKRIDADGSLIEWCVLCIV